MGRWVSKPLLGTPIDQTVAKELGLVGDWLFNEGAGLRANDGSGYGNHGTLTNMANPPTPTSGWNPGKDGWALAFDGTDDRVAAPASNSLDITGAITVMACVRSNNWSLISGILSKHDGTASSPVYTLLTYASNIRFRVVGPTDIEVLTSTVGLNTTDFYLVVGTYDGIRLKLYVNNILKDDDPSTGNITSQPTWWLDIGKHKTYEWNGQISYAKVFNRALQPSEITQLSSDPYYFYQQPRNVKYFVISAPTGIVYPIFSRNGIHKRQGVAA